MSMQSKTRVKKVAATRALVAGTPYELTSSKLTKRSRLKKYAQRGAVVVVSDSLSGFMNSQVYAGQTGLARIKARSSVDRARSKPDQRTMSSATPIEEPRHEVVSIQGLLVAQPEKFDRLVQYWEGVQRLKGEERQEAISLLKPVIAELIGTLE